MKLIGSLVVAFFLIVPPLLAQQLTNTDLQQTNATPSATIAETPRPQEAPELSKLDEAFKQTSMGKAADSQRLRLEWRQLKNRVVNDADLIAMKRAANRSRTDLEKRDRLREYYKLFFARLRQFPMSPEMKQYINGMEAGQLNAISQPRVRPSPTASPTEPPR